ncbi:MAG: flagellar basal body protein [Pseudomonadota bacterium]
MSVNDLPLLSDLAQRLTHLSARSSVLTENIANADTPGYRAKDVKAPAFSDAVRRNRAALSARPLRVSDPRHQNRVSDQQPGVETRRVQSGSLSGNGVSVERETMALSQTRMEYGLAAQVYRKSIDLMRLAISSGR